MPWDPGDGSPRVPMPPSGPRVDQDLADLERRQRIDDRRMSPSATKVTYRLNGRNEYRTLTDVAAGTPVEVTIYPPGGAAYAMTVRANAAITDGAILTIGAQGISDHHSGGNSTTAAGGSGAAAADVDVASTASPLVAVVRWGAEGSPDPVTVHLQIISTPL